MSVSGNHGWCSGCLMGLAGCCTRGDTRLFRRIPDQPDQHLGYIGTGAIPAEAQALGPNTARRHAYDKIQTCVTDHWNSLSPDWPVSCRPVNGVHDYPFPRLERDIPAAVCAANPGHPSIRVSIRLQVSGRIGCENPSGVNDWGIRELSSNFTVTCNTTRPAVIPHSKNTNRPGMDYRNLRIDSGKWRTCYKECASDDRCHAWTFVKPGIQGARARCWLKNGVPPARPDSCCVSGVIGRGLE